MGSEMAAGSFIDALPLNDLLKLFKTENRLTLASSFFMEFFVFMFLTAVMKKIQTCKTI